MNNIDYQRIAEAIQYISDHFKEQPDLDAVAAAVHLSPFHFQRLFKEWAGVSPKKFTQYISLQYAKELLRKQQSLADVSFETGLSGTSRLHDLFVSIEGMTPGEYKNGGESLVIDYAVYDTPFGPCLIASTMKGICHMSFLWDDEDVPFALQKAFPRARLVQRKTHIQQSALHLFEQNRHDLPAIKLHLKGTPFQLKVWEALLHIPSGGVQTYGTIASAIQMPMAARAVGTAVGDNPVAYLIPCHRVIRSSGITGQYHWGAARKKAMLGWEAARVFGEEQGE
ncbi:bifunctional transcriptional activator/DNA repair enzyme AdaA [Deminuibacter soli]|uniref:methylated-DNA--[protein]-cysteine S-methyltransferase n=1 Tax=Deminuibacter soli TaxID=2291815 RepID=A0A3E1NGX1_9BACT|nr:methylated-DNA--[protein]-cysteine S-methyltransferase [Deminuibacter soli]RFM27185.1 methylated-DNA--[protein]-cysteine S-methyltransferase [Deminuibacter soli]